MTRGQSPERGRYEIRPHMAAGVVAIYWVDDPAAAGYLITTVNEKRLPLLAAAITRHRNRKGSP